MRTRTLAWLLIVPCAVTLVAATVPVRASARRPSPSRFHRQIPKPRPQAPPAPEEFDPPEVTIGERLFLETRFAQFFAAFVNGGGDPNAPLAAGDPVVDYTETTGAPLPGPFAGLSINCRSCHLVDEQLDATGEGMRTYSDFARRSPIPARVDALLTAPRNAPPLVNASVPRDGGLLLHFDGEFTTLRDLVESTFTGRNFGWLPRESRAAVAHLARIVRTDDGRGDLAGEFGGLSYRTVLTGTDPSIPPEFRLPKAFRVNVARATDSQIVEAVANLVTAYTEQLVFSTDEDGNFNLSPFDVFLDVNDLPRRPGAHESAIDYCRRLLNRIRQKERRGALRFVTSNPNTPAGSFDFHPSQVFQFTSQELAGLEIFFAEPPHQPLKSKDIAGGTIGNCIACHQAPLFTDFRLHNTGATQLEYDAIHGADAFSALSIPGLGQRLVHHERYLPATPSHPDATSVFRSVPSASTPGATDLGVWNVFANPDFPKPQGRLWQILCEDEIGSTRPPGLLGLLLRCSPRALLSTAIGKFKTPGLRDLSHSGPYMHNGQFDALEDVINLYRTTSTLQRAHSLRNGDRELANIALTPADLLPLVAFLRSLNEDYQ